MTWRRSSRRRPTSADLKPGGKYVAFDLYNVAAASLSSSRNCWMRPPARRRADGDRQDAAENHKDVTFPENQDVVYRVKNACHRPAAWSG